MIVYNTTDVCKKKLNTYLHSHFKSHVKFNQITITLRE